MDRTISNNKIADFVGREDKTNLQYHTSQNWLYPVIDYIEAITGTIFDVKFTCWKNQVSIQASKYTTDETGTGLWIFYPVTINGDNYNGRKLTRFQAAYEAVLLFIEWYEQNKD
jgi:hypothetical protein